MKVTTDNEGHHCDTCERDMTAAECEVVDNLEEIQQHINESTLNAMVYIAGYLEKKITLHISV